MVGAAGEESNKGDAQVAVAIAAGNVTLEVTAYPAVPFAQSGHRYAERQRVAITAESLWQRRRSLNPQVTLFDKPPRDLTGWLSYKNSVSSSEEREVTRAGIEQGGREGATRASKTIPLAGAVDGGRGGTARGSETARAGALGGGAVRAADRRESQRGEDPKEFGDGRDRAGGTGGAVHEALGDLVGMVAFGPSVVVAKGDSRCEGSQSV